MTRDAARLRHAEVRTGKPGRPEVSPVAESLDAGERGGRDPERVTPTALVERLVAEGMTRLGAERAAAIQRGLAEPGRARRHRTAGW